MSGLVILVLAVTGTLLTYERQIISSAETRLVSEIGEHALSADALSELAKNIGGAGANVRISDNPGAPVKVLVRGDQTLIHPSTGEVLLVGKTKTAKTFETITLFHRWFALSGDAQETGKAITNIANLLFVFLVISGVYLWFTPIFRWLVIKTKMMLKLKPPTGKARDYNWHHVFSFWMYVPIFVMATTGAVISYSWANALVFGVFGEQPQSLRAPPAIEMQAPPAMSISEPITLQERLNISTERHPNWNTVSFPANAALNSPTSFDLDFGNGAQPHKRLKVTISPSGAIVSEVDTFKQRTPGTRARLFIRFLHTGEALGFLGQTLAGLGSLATLFLVWSGLALSYRRLVRPRLRRT